MKVRQLPLWLVITGLCACGDDGSSSDGSADGGSSGGVTDSADGTDSSDDDGLPTVCEDDADCEDDNACTDEECGSEGLCEFVPVQSNECRTQIDVEFPPRAATIEGSSGNPTVTVTGRVSSGAGSAETLVINGDDVPLDDDGTFSYPMTPTVGGNTLVLDATDMFGVPRRRVQSFLWSTEYRKPTTPSAGIANQGLAFYLGQEVIDDLDRSQPPDDLATILNMALDNFDVGSFADPTTPITHNAGYDIYLTDITLGSTLVTLDSIDGGILLEATLEDVEGDLEFDCTNALCLAAGGDSTGGFTVTTLGIAARVILVVNSDNELDVIVQDVTSMIDPDNVDLFSNNGWTNFLLSIIEPLIIDGVVADIGGELEGQVEGLLGPALGTGLNQLAITTTIDLPNIGDPENPILVLVTTDFDDVDFNDGQSPPAPTPPQGGLIVQRGGGYADESVTPYSNLGVPSRMACGGGDPEIDIPRVSALEIGLSDDLLNQILYSAWRGGLLEFPGDSLVGGGAFEISKLDVSGMLAPTASDCGTGELLAHAGDLRLDAEIDFFGSPMTFTAFSTLLMTMEVTADEEGVGITVTGVDSITTELTINEDHLIESEELVKAGLEDELSSSLISFLGGGFGAIAIPEIDLSSQLGLPAGSAVIAIQFDSVTREEGTTVVSGHL